jgi:hypothetical protein
MNLPVLLELLNIFFGGILAGIEISAHYGFHSPTMALDDKSQLRFRQGAIRKLRWLVPAFFLPTALTGIALTIIEGFGPGYIFRFTGVASLLVWIAVRAVGTVPINAATLEWNAENPPHDWKARIAKAEQFHIIGTWAAIAAFTFFLLSLGIAL